MVGKAHQRIIREKFIGKSNGELFANPSNPNIKDALLKKIDYNTAKRIILKFEWLGTMGMVDTFYGIYFEGVLAGAVCFGAFQAMNTNSGGHPYAPYVGEEFSEFGTQLSRGACAEWCHKHGGSKLIGYALREQSRLGHKYCIAFSDPEAGEIGTLYQATNWYYLGFSTTTHYDIYYKGGNKIFINDRDFYKKNGFVGKTKMLEWLKNKPHLFLKKRMPKARYIKLLGNKRENKIMMKYLENKIKPYIKRG